jgi:hypothetical protein
MGVNTIYSLRSNRAAVIALLAIVSFGYSFVLYGLSVAGLQDLSADAVRVWRPLSQAMAEGARPYVDVPDTKPPLFIYLVAIGSLTNFGIALTLFDAIANATVVVAAYRWCADHDLADAGVIAALLIAGTIIVHSNGINNKIYGVAAVFVTLHLRRSISVGAGLAIAGLFAQPVVIAIPAVVLWKFGTNRRALATVAGTGIAVVAATFASLALVWDVSTALAGFEQSFLSSGSYTQGRNAQFGANLSPFTNPFLWASELYSTLRRTAIPLLGGVIGGGLIIRQRRRDAIAFMLVLAGSLALVFLIRPYWHYGMIVMVPFSILAGYGVVALANETQSGQE